MSNTKNKKDLDDYKNIAIKKNFTYILPDIPKNVLSSVEGWKCNSCDYLKKACYSNIQQYNKKGCKNCSTKKLKDYINIAIISGLYTYILNSIPKNTDSYIEGWKCNVCGVVKNSRYKDIYFKVGCMNCSYTKPKTIENYTLIAQENNMTYLPDYIPERSDYSITGWRCNDCGSIRTMRYSNVRQHNGCALCSKSKSEKLCREIFMEIFDTKFPNMRPSFLNGLELDGYNEEKNIAFEYQGKQHYEYTEFYHRNGIEDLYKQQKRDMIKKNLCEKEGIILIIIPCEYSYVDRDRLSEYIIDQVIELYVLNDKKVIFY